MVGGERQVFQAELSLLRDNGHEVEVYIDDNKRVAQLGGVRTAVKTLWSAETYQRIRRTLRESQFDIVHVHNFFPLISPSIYYAAHAERVPIVQTLHNFRLLCANANLFRDGKVCEDCLGRPVPWPGIRHACYRDSLGGSAVVVGMLSLHRAIKTWKKKINTYIALSEFSRQKLIEGGLPGEKIVVKPNFISRDPGFSSVRRPFALYVGRLSPEKGITTMLDAWQLMDEEIPLKIVGDGPLSEQVSSRGASLPTVEYLGRLDNDQVLEMMRKAAVLVFPTLCYENFPITIIEAYAAGLPVIASQMGNAANLIHSQQTGLHFIPGDAQDLATKVKWIMKHPEQRKNMGLTARTTYEQQFTPAQNYLQLRSIYENTITSAQNGR
ncbi:MAG: glycosyltransferase family 4 protein [Candidatus Promineifilaceae bacterium]|nr:glycosyltransferase family 4 protein [Candidatus Promineifilaceae bacterium]